MHWPQTGATQYHAQLGLPDKGRTIKGVVVCYSWDLEPWDLLNGLALGCYQPSPEVWLVPSVFKIYKTIKNVSVTKGTNPQNYLSSIVLSINFRINFHILWCPLWDFPHYKLRLNTPILWIKSARHCKHHEDNQMPIRRTCKIITGGVRTSIHKTI